MEIFTNIWNNWSNYEKSITFITVLLILVIIPLSVLFFTKNKKLFLLSIFSLLIVGVLATISLICMSIIFHIHITDTFKLVPFVCTFINILNLGTMVGYYAVNRKRTDFGIEELHQEAMRDTFKLSIILITLFCLSTIFLSTDLFTVIIISLGISLLTIWINYTMLIKFVK